MDNASAKKIDLSLIIPVFNEETVLEELSKRLNLVLETMKINYEVIFINDGSHDGSQKIIERLNKENADYKGLVFSRNFGHQIAISAGLDYAQGDAAIIMDADLQDPPELIPRLYEKWLEGYEMVCAKRESRKDGSFKKFTAHAFYRLFNKISDISIPLDTGDFRLLDKKIVLTLRSFREKNRFLRGLYSWAGYRQAYITFNRGERYAGETHYPLIKMIKLAVDGLLSFTALPLRLATWLGIISACAGFAGIIWVVIIRFLPNYTSSGWATLMTTVLFLGGIQLFIMGMIGEYLSRVYTEVQNRPLYIIKDKIGVK